MHLIVEFRKLDWIWDGLQGALIGEDFGYSGCK